MFDALADSWQGRSEDDHAFIFGFVSHLTPTRMVAALLSSPCISACDLEVTLGVWTDPDFGPGRGDDEGLDSRQSVGIAYYRSAGVEIAEAFAPRFA